MVRKLNISSGLCHPRSSDSLATAIRSCGCKFAQFYRQQSLLVRSVSSKSQKDNSELLELCQRRLRVETAKLHIFVNHRSSLVLFSPRSHRFHVQTELRESLSFLITSLKNEVEDLEKLYFFAREKKNKDCGWHQHAFTHDSSSLTNWCARWHRQTYKDTPQKLSASKTLTLHAELFASTSVQNISPLMRRN